MKQLPVWLDTFPQLKAVEDPAWMKVVQNMREVALSADTELFTCGNDSKHFILLLSGAVRVYQTFENGREMVLYHLQAGECCSLTISTLLSNARYSASGIAESEVRVVLIPKRDFCSVFDASTGFRRYVCAELGKRFHDLLFLLEGLGKRNVELRLARWLLDNRTESDCIVASHRELASELGTAREVISRHLKEFEKKGLVRLSRKFIELADISALDDRASSVCN
jgi:CRP/FNR family transcriptional regulator